MIDFNKVLVDNTEHQVPMLAPLDAVTSYKIFREPERHTVLTRYMVQVKIATVIDIDETKDSEPLRSIAADRLFDHTYGGIAHELNLIARLHQEGNHHTAAARVTKLQAQLRELRA